MYFYRPYHQTFFPGNMGFGFGGLLGFLFWGLVLFLLIALLVKIFSGKSRNNDEEETEKEEVKDNGNDDEELIKILKRRYAKGEITAREFEKMKKELL